MTHIDHVADRVGDLIPTTAMSANTPEERAKARITVAANARNAADCALILSKLGLDREDTAGD